MVMAIRNGIFMSHTQPYSITITRRINKSPTKDTPQIKISTILIRKTNFHTVTKRRRKKIIIKRLHLKKTLNTTHVVSHLLKKEEKTQSKGKAHV